MIHIGIDPDIEKSGVAVWDNSDKSLELYTLSFPDLLEKLKAYNVPIQVVIEAGWLIKKSNWHTAQGQFRRERIAKNVGENHAVGKLLAEVCKSWNINYTLVLPKGKINSDEFYRITKVKKSNQEVRDAAMLVFGK